MIVKKFSSTAGTTTTGKSAACEPLAEGKAFLFVDDAHLKKRYSGLSVGREVTGIWGGVNDSDSQPAKRRNTLQFFCP